MNNSEINHQVGVALATIAKKHNRVVIAHTIPEQSLTGFNSFLGIGLLFRGKVSHGLCLGAIPLLCVQTELRKLFPDSESHILVADQHALTAMGLNPKPENVDRLTESAGRVEETLIRAMGLGFLGNNPGKTHVIKASLDTRFNPDSAKLGTSGKPYEDRQINVDRAVAVQQLMCGVFVGWESKRQPQNGIPVRDEKYFQELGHRQRPDLPVACIRTMEGIGDFRNGEHEFIPPYFSDSQAVALGRHSKSDSRMPGANPSIRELANTTKQRGNYLAAVASTLMNTLGIPSSKDKRPLDTLQEFVQALGEKSNFVAELKR
ncbi:hypothetical protein KBC79_06065 [Candidatus Woesebacteria bacterium]|nr:hypothetical protein [Candidatus Woesebacteria bacterium]